MASFLARISNRSPTMFERCLDVAGSLAAISTVAILLHGGV